MNKKVWLDYLYYKVGKQYTNFSLTSTIKKGEDIYFSKWKTYLEAQENPYLLFKANQRTLLANEIVLECDGTIEQYHNIIKSLKQANFRFYAYATKENRCKHIHLFFGTDFLNLSKDQRERYSLMMIRKYQCDPQVKGERHMVALEFCPHWKTGQKKEVVAYG